MTFTRQESAALDRYLTQGPPDEEEMWCPHCKTDSDECEQPDEHMGDWSTYEDKACGETLYDPDDY